MSPTGTQARGTGVGCAVRIPLQAVPVKMNTKRARIAYEQGRMAIYWLQNRGKAVIVATVYGKTGGHDDLEAAQYTDDLLDACHCEFATQPAVPKCIVGDINAEAEDIPTLMHLIEDLGWIDCGATADIWGEEVRRPTCFAKSAKKANKEGLCHSGPGLCQIDQTFSSYR